MTIDQKIVGQVVDYVKAHYSKPVIRVKAEKAEGLGLTDSKFGGLPYWEKGRECPCTSDGKPLFMIVQMNFAQMNSAQAGGEVALSKEFPLLPETGILQFFIASDDLMGLNFDDPTKQDTFRVVYHKDVDEDVTAEDVMATGMGSGTMLNREKEYLPLYDEYKLSFVKDSDCVDYCLEDEYEEAIRKALDVVCQMEVDNDAFEQFFDENDDELVENLSEWGHKIFGYPNFTQYDPRDEEQKEEFDTLLFQMDSQDNDILWGDCGVANFFICSENLKNLDFSKVLYNWDCY